jgi:hypothetical protein
MAARRHVVGGLERTLTRRRVHRPLAARRGDGRSEVGDRDHQKNGGDRQDNEPRVHVSAHAVEDPVEQTEQHTLHGLAIARVDCEQRHVIGQRQS